MTYIEVTKTQILQISDVAIEVVGILHERIHRGVCEGSHRSLKKMPIFWNMLLLEDNIS